MAREKEFNTLDRQVEIQQSRNLKISDVKKAKKNFATKNYFNMINGFETLILEEQHPNKIYANGKNIKDFYRAYQLDKKISEQLFLQIAKVETELKARIAYFFCEKYCQKDVNDNLKYEDINCYNIPKKGSSKSRYTNFFYNTFTNRRSGKTEIDNRRTHSLFRDHSISVSINKMDFKGDIEKSSKKNEKNILYLKGSFNGTIQGLKTNEFSGTLKIDQSKCPNILFVVGTNKTLTLKQVWGTFYSLSYSDFCKIKYPYISSYKMPPFWVIINTFMLNELIILFHGLDNDIQNKIVDKMGPFDLKESGKEEFINSLEILVGLRNLTAHYGLVTRFRTANNLSISKTLIKKLKLSPKTSDKVIRFYDVIQVLSIFHSFSDAKISRYTIRYIVSNMFYSKNDINKHFYRRIGANGISPWLKK